MSAIRKAISVSILSQFCLRTPAGENLMAYARNTARGAARPVGTQSWIVERWMGGAGALLDEMPLPTGVIRRVPNMLACTDGACLHRRWLHVQGRVCARYVYGLAGAGADDAHERVLVLSEGEMHGCTRRVHNCSSNDRWLVSPFDLGNKSRVQW